MSDNWQQWMKLLLYLNYVKFEFIDSGSLIQFKDVHSDDWKFESEGCYNSISFLSVWCCFWHCHSRIYPTLNLIALASVQLKWDYTLSGRLSMLSIYCLETLHCALYRANADKCWGPLKDLGLWFCWTYFNGLRAPKGKSAVFLCSIAGLQRLHFLKFEKTTMEIVWALGLQAFKMMSSKAPLAPPLGAPIFKVCLTNGRLLHLARSGSDTIQGRSSLLFSVGLSLPQWVYLVTEHLGMCLQIGSIFGWKCRNRIMPFVSLSGTGMSIESSYSRTKIWISVCVTSKGDWSSHSGQVPCFKCSFLYDTSYIPGLDHTIALWEAH